MPLWSTKTLEWFNDIWFFLRSGLPWSIWHEQNNMVFNALQWPVDKTHQVIWDTLQDYGRIEWKQTLSYLTKAPDVAYQDVNEFDSIQGGVKGLIVTRTNLVVMWKVGPKMAIISWFPLGLRWFSRGGCFWFLFIIDFSMWAKEKKR